MAMSRNDQKEFEIFALRVKYVLQNLLFSDPALFDTHAMQLSDDDKIGLMHVGELEAAAIVLGENSNTLLAKDPKLAEVYQKQMRLWISGTGDDQTSISVSSMVSRDTISDLIEELDMDLSVADEDDKDEVLNALESAQATLANFKAEIGVGKTRLRR